MTVLIVEDERAIMDILRFNLQKEGYDTLEAMDGPTGLSLGLTGDPDLILLDLMLPGMNGLEICARLRKAGVRVPILMLTAREEENDMILGLESGADDYITKPFSMRELLARIRASIRRRDRDAPQEPPAPAGPKALRLDPERCAVVKNGVSVDLTQKEFDLLSCLSGQPGRIFSREDLISTVWKYDYYGDMRTVDVTVRRLREKIEDDPGTPALILTRRGVGYYYAEEA